MKSVISKGLLAAVVGVLLCSVAVNACPGDKACGAGEKGAAKKDKVSDKPKAESTDKAAAPKADEKTAEAK